MKVKVSHTVMSDSLQSHGLQPAWLLCPWNSLGKSTGMSSHSLLQRIFLSQGLNPGLLRCRQIFGSSHKPKLLHLINLNLLPILTALLGCKSPQSLYNSYIKLKKNADWTLEWLSITLRIKTKILTMAYLALGDLVPCSTPGSQLYAVHSLRS